MNILYFTNPDVTTPEEIPSFLRSFGDHVILHTAPITEQCILDHHIDFVVSDRSRHLIKAPVINLLGGRVINLHPSYLPYGRGYQPIFWAIHDNVPVGYTLHYIDPGIDSGDIIDQHAPAIQASDTLREVYDRCRSGLISLLHTHWPALRQSGGPRLKQATGKSIHYSYEFDGIFEILPKGWDSTVADVRSMKEKIEAMRIDNLAKRPKKPVAATT